MDFPETFELLLPSGIGSQSVPPRLSVSLFSNRGVRAMSTQPMKSALPTLSTSSQMHLRVGGDHVPLWTCLFLRPARSSRQTLPRQTGSSVFFLTEDLKCLSFSCFASFLSSENWPPSNSKRTRAVGRASRTKQILVLDGQTYFPLNKATRPRSAPGRARRRGGTSL